MEWQLRLSRALRRGALVATDFSGMESPRWAMQSACETIPCRRHIPVSPAIKFVRSSDLVARPQQDFLMRMSNRCDFGRACVFGCIEDRLSTTASRMLSAMEPEAMSSKSDREAAYECMHVWLFKNLDMAFPTGHEVPCRQHGACIANVGEELDRWLTKRLDTGRWSGDIESPDGPDGPDSMERRPLLVNMASTVCKGWSPANRNRDGGAHPSERSHAIWLAERAALAGRGQEDLYFHECSSHYPVQGAMRQRVAQTHEVVSVVCCPTQRGRPVRRRRRFSAGLSRPSLVYVGESDVQREFNLFISRPQAGNPSMFMIADDVELRATVGEVAAARLCFFGDETRTTMDLPGLWQLAFTPGEQQRFRAWMDLCKPGGPDEFFDIRDHSSPHTDRQCLPTVMTKSLVCSRSRGAPLSASELGVAMGVPPSLESFWDIFGSLTFQHRMILVGNSLHLEMYAMWILFVLGNTTPRERMRVEALRAPDTGVDSDSE